MEIAAKRFKNFIIIFLTFIKIDLVWSDAPENFLDFDHLDRHLYWLTFFEYWL